VTSHDGELEANFPRRRQKDGLKLNALRMQLEAGIAELERGDFIEIDEADLGSYLENLRIDRSNARPE
jgi:antitoxin ParD1/3/4